MDWPQYTATVTTGPDGSLTIQLTPVAVVLPPVVIPSEPATPTKRVAGLSWAHPEAVGKHPMDRPALKLSAFATFRQAVSAAREAGKAIDVDVDMAIQFADLAQRNVPLYGRGGTLTYVGPKPTTNTPCLMYAYDGDVIVPGVIFRGFGDVLGGCVNTVPRPPLAAWAFLNTGAYGFARCVPAGVPIRKTVGTGVEVHADKYPHKLGQEGPGFDLRDATFINCERAVHLQSDSLHFGPVIADRVKAIGTWGIVDQICTVLADTFARNAEYRDCIGDRRQPSNNCNGMHTAFSLGVDKSPDFRVRKVRIQIENCLGENIIDGNTSPTGDTNSAVFVDARNYLAANIRDFDDPRQAMCDASISYNELTDMRGEMGNEDCNAIYAKPHGLVVDGNKITRCGEPDRRGEKQGASDGSEATGVLIKDPFGGFAADEGVFLAIRGNTFDQMPSNPSTKTGPQFVIKMSDVAPARAYILDNLITNTDIPTDTGELALIRTYNETGDLFIESNCAVNCNVPPHRLIWLASHKQAPGRRMSIEGNTVNGVSVNAMVS